MRTRLSLVLLTVVAAAWSANLAAFLDTAAAQSRYSLANGCYALRAESGRFVVKNGEGYRASAGTAAEGEPFRMQATRLGSYLFYGRERDFLAASSDLLGGSRRIESAASPSESADWEVRGRPGSFTIHLPGVGGALAVSGGGDLVLGSPARLTFEPVKGCADYPEVELNTVGEPRPRSPLYGEVVGTSDTHVHLMQFEALGGRIFCGRAWHPYGAPYALVDCPEHEATAGGGDVAGHALAQEGPHDTRGWPTFNDWPRWDSLTHQQLYYRWLERGWRGGLRLFVNLFNEVEVLCEIWPYKPSRTPCNEMAGIRNQIVRIRELEDYIDAQNGGPGKGWFRIVDDPFEARRVINRGKLAVVLGMENGKPFDCDVWNDVPQCDRAQIDRGLDEIKRLGVSALYAVHKVDNALAGVAFDEHTTGQVSNTGNRLETGRSFQIKTCDTEEHDRPQTNSAPPGNVLLTNALEVFVPPGAAPVYPPEPHCNLRGLTELGEYMVRGLMKRGLILDPDHMSVRTRNGALALLESEGYSGVSSTHSWSTLRSYQRILAVGGFVNPIAPPTEIGQPQGDSTDFIKAWRMIRRMSTAPYYFGLGYGADVGGGHEQPAPRPRANQDGNPVRYPFKSLDGSVTLHRQRSGQRTFDVNVDGVAHYGLYPDWIQDMRNLAGEQFAQEMSRGAESYLQMWERARGIPGPRCRFVRGHFKRRGLAWMRLGFSPAELLKRGGQPASRFRVWRYCVRAHRDPKGTVLVVFTRRHRVGLVASTARGHEAHHIAPGSRARRLRGRARRIGRNLWVRRVRRGVRFVYGVRRGRVRYTAAASPSVAKSRRRLRAYLRLAGLR